VLINGQESGKVTSGCMSPSLSKSIAMAYIKVKDATDGAQISIDAGKAQLAGKIVPLPFYKATK